MLDVSHSLIHWSKFSKNSRNMYNLSDKVYYLQGYQFRIMFNAMLVGIQCEYQNS